MATSLQQLSFAHDFNQLLLQSSAEYMAALAAAAAAVVNDGHDLEQPAFVMVAM